VGVGAHLRADWAKELGIKTLAEDPQVEYLFFVGCAGSFDDRGKKVSVALAKIMRAGGSVSASLERKKGAAGIQPCGVGMNISTRRWHRPTSRP